MKDRGSSDRVLYRPERPSTLSTRGTTRFCCRRPVSPRCSKICESTLETKQLLVGAHSALMPEPDRSTTGTRSRCAMPSLPRVPQIVRPRLQTCSTRSDLSHETRCRGHVRRKWATVSETLRLPRLWGRRAGRVALGSRRPCVDGVLKNASPTKQEERRRPGPQRRMLQVSEQ